MQKELLFSGFGGQGVMFVGQLLAYTAMDEGFEATWIPSYGPEMRGGTAHCYVVISDQAIGSPIVKHPQVTVIFNIPSFERYEPLIAPGGLLVRNSTLVPLETQRTDITDLAIPATDLAEEMGYPRLANVMLLAATLTAYPVLTIDALKKSIDAHIPAHHRDKLPANYEAIDKGVEFATALEIAPIMA